VRYDFTRLTNFETALHDALLEFNDDLAERGHSIRKRIATCKFLVAEVL